MITTSPVEGLRGVQVGHGQQSLAQRGCLVNASDSSPPLTVLPFRSTVTSHTGFPEASSLLPFLPFYSEPAEALL